MRMKDDRNERTEPVCKFGPGGDYVSFWPPGSYELPRLSTNSLTKVLLSLSKIIENLVGSESGNILAGRAANRFVCGKGDFEDVVKSSTTDKPGHPASNAVIKDDRAGPGEPMLFADDWRAGGRAGHKPKHHIRAHRRTAKKRVSVSLSGQGSLFELDLQGAGTA